MHFYIKNFDQPVCRTDGEYHYLEKEMTVVVADETGTLYKFTLYPGFKTDGGSVPWAFRWFMPSWDENVPLLCVAYMLHDWLYASREMCKAYADDLLRGLLRDAGYDRFHASTVCWAVDTFGRSHFGTDEFGIADLGKLEILTSM